MTPSPPPVLLPVLRLVFRGAPRPTAEEGRAMSRSVTARSTSAAVRLDSRCGPRPGEQLVEQDAERVDVGRRRDRLAPHLLRRRVLRRQRPREARSPRRRRLVASSVAAASRCRSRAASPRPSAVTRMFEGLRSRWTTRLRCAYCDRVADLGEQRAAAARRRAAVRRSRSVIGSPST